MFSINIFLRFGIIIGAIVLGGLLTWLYGFWYAFPFFLVSLILLVGYFLTGTIQSSGLLIQVQDFESAKKRLALTFFPKLLLGPARSAYYMLQGSLAMQEKNYQSANAFFKESENSKFTSDNEKAMIYLQQANLSAVKGNFREAQIIFSKTANLNVTEQMIKDQLKQFEMTLKQGSQVKMHQRVMAAQRGGSKQRRPKMR